MNSVTSSSQNTIEKTSCSNPVQINYSYDHHKLAAIMAHLSYEYADFKYTVYRCAAKFLTLQRVFNTGNIPFKLVTAILERHHIRNADINFMVPPFQLATIVRDLFLASEKLGYISSITTFCLETASTVLSNFFWNIFDPQRRHSTSLLEIKITLLLLCKLGCNDLAGGFYFCLTDSSKRNITKFKFEYLLKTLAKIISYMGEATAYGMQNIPLIMEQCFDKISNREGLTEDQFYKIWSNPGTRFIIYTNLIALIKRMEETKNLIHNNSCAACHLANIIGIRFKCQNCKDLSLCLKCFATGYASAKHVPGHRMHEVYKEDPPPKKFSHYFSKLCFLFFQTNIEETRWFCNSNDTANFNETELVTIVDTQNSSNSRANTVANANNKLHQMEIPPDKKDHTGQPLPLNLTGSSFTVERMQTIIDRLLRQNAKIEYQLKTIKTATTEEISAFLTTHQTFLIDIIKEMRNLSTSTRYNNSPYPASSTPNRSLGTTHQTVVQNFKNVNLSHSMNGADLNRSYLEANKSDYSLADLSSWFNQRKMGYSIPNQSLGKVKQISPFAETEFRETEMINFKFLLNKVKEIVEDSCSDNTELSAATQNLENVLDNIIKSEEGRRRSA